MSHYRGSKISGSTQSFLTETTICIIKRWKKRMGYYFVPECNHAQQSHMGQIFQIFLFFFAGPWFVEIPKILLPWQCDLTISPL